MQRLTTEFYPSETFLESCINYCLSPITTFLGKRVEVMSLKQQEALYEEAPSNRAATVASIVAGAYFGKMAFFAALICGSVRCFHPRLVSKYDSYKEFSDAGLALTQQECIDLYFNYEKQIEIAEGKTQVYEIPYKGQRYILKLSKEQSEDRFLKMIQVRRLIKKLGLEQTITVAKVRCVNSSTFEHFLIEEALPINPKAMPNMQIYCQNSTAFDQLVEDMVVLFYKVDIKDIYTSDLAGINLYNPLIGLSGDVFRFDNMPFYLEGGRAKIGLVDLERASIDNPSSLGYPFVQRQIPDRLNVLVRMFPFHEKLIRQKARELGLVLNASFCDHHQRGIDYYTKGCIEWVVFKRNNPESKLCTKLNDLQGELTEEIMNQLILMGQGEWDRDLFKKSGFTCPTKNMFCQLGSDMQQLKSLSNELVELMTRKTIMAIGINKADPRIRSIGESNRFCVLGGEQGRSWLYKEVRQKCRALMEKLEYPYQDEDVAHVLFSRFFACLQKQGAIYRYDPIMCSLGANLCLIAH